MSALAPVLPLEKGAEDGYASVFPSGKNMRLLTQATCAGRSRTNSPVSAFHTATDAESSPLRLAATNFPSGETATFSVCSDWGGVSVRTGLPVVTSQILT